MKRRIYLLFTILIVCASTLWGMDKRAEFLLGLPLRMSPELVIDNFSRYSPRSAGGFNPIQLAQEHLSGLNNLGLERRAYASTITELTIPANLLESYVTASIPIERLFEEMGRLFTSVTRLTMPGSISTVPGVDSSRINDEILKIVVKNFKQLTHLDIRNNALTINGVLALIEHVPGLQELTLAGNHAINDASLELIARGLANLRRLDLSSINTSYEQRTLTAVGFSLLSRMSSLRSLSLANNFITQDDILALRGKIPKPTRSGGSHLINYDQLDNVYLNLEELDLTNNPYIVIRLHEIIQPDRQVQLKLYRLTELLRVLQEMGSLAKIIVTESGVLTRQILEELVNSEEFPCITKIIWK